jgi:hypothetical protein
MKPKDIFALVVRLIGLIFLYQGLQAVPAAVANVCLLFPHFIFRNLLPSLWLVGWPLLVAYWLVRGAPRLLRLAYGDDSQSAQTSPEPARVPIGSRES